MFIRLAVAAGWVIHSVALLLISLPHLIYNTLTCQLLCFCSWFSRPSIGGFTPPSSLLRSAQPLLWLLQYMRAVRACVHACVLICSTVWCRPTLLDLSSPGCSAEAQGGSKARARLKREQLLSPNHSRTPTCTPNYKHTEHFESNLLKEGKESWGQKKKNHERIQAWSHWNSSRVSVQGLILSAGRIAKISRP